VTPPGKQAENCENKPHPEALEETGLLDQIRFAGADHVGPHMKHRRVVKAGSDGGRKHRHQSCRQI